MCADIYPDNSYLGCAWLLDIKVEFETLQK